MLVEEDVPRACKTAVRRRKDVTSCSWDQFKGGGVGRGPRTVQAVSMGERERERERRVGGSA